LSLSGYFRVVTKGFSWRTVDKVDRVLGARDKGVHSCRGALLESLVVAMSLEVKALLMAAVVAMVYGGGRRDQTGK
jgi:hypothetical protein